MVLTTRYLIIMEKTLKYNIKLHNMAAMHQKNK